MGGINHYQYAPNPVNWVDPLGLSCKGGYAVVRQFINGRQEGHFTIEVLHSDLNYATHQVITTEDWSETTIVRAGGFNEKGHLVREAKIPLPNAELAIITQKNMIRQELGPYNVYENSCLSHVVDILSAGEGPKYDKTRRGYFQFFKENDFGRLPTD